MVEATFSFPFFPGDFERADILFFFFSASSVAIGLLVPFLPLMTSDAFSVGDEDHGDVGRPVRFSLPLRQTPLEGSRG